MRQASTITVTIIRLGNDPQTVTLEPDSTVAMALEKAGLDSSLAGSTSVAGVQAKSDDILDDGDVLQVVTPKQAGHTA